MAPQKSMRCPHRIRVHLYSNMHRQAVCCDMDAASRDFDGVRASHGVALEDGEIVLRALEASIKYTADDGLGVDLNTSSDS